MANITDDEALATVGVLLRAAGLDVPEEEVQRLAGLYPGLRRSADRFHQVEVGDEVPSAIFRAGDVNRENR
ncbi:MAG: hypothetical protein ACI8TP_001054 [Acidimicrobiales bacterium]|jgi:hypothetical protein